MQTQGSLQESSLASLLQTMQTERATGALSLETESDSAALFFLFGHLFHAQSPEGQGEDVVINALSWQDGHFRFDPRAKLPPEETIKASPSELIAEAERRVATAALPEEQQPWDGQAPYLETEASPYEAEGYPAAADLGYAEPTWEEASEVEPQPQAPGYSAWGFPTAEPPGTPVPYQEPEVPPRPPAERTPEPAPVEHYRAPEPAPVRAPARAQAGTGYARPAPMPAPLPAPSPPAAVPETVEQVAVGGAVGAVPMDIVYPLPSGRVQYEGLKSAFVDFPKLLRTLRGDQQTGYVRMSGGEFAGVLLFHQGLLLDALSSESGARNGEAAFRAVRRSMDAGTCVLDVVDLPGDTVDALAKLLAAPLLYTGLLGGFINFDGLLAHLAEERVDGAVVVLADDEVGIILLTQGKLLGAYTHGNPTLSSVTGAVAKIAADKGARIEVKSGPGEAGPLDVERLLSQRY